MLGKILNSKARFYSRKSHDVGVTNRRKIVRGAMTAVVAAVTLFALGTQAPSVKATPLPVIAKSGTLSSDETWANGSVYMVSGTLVVPSGITLTIDPGAIVKYAYSGSTISVTSGGTLDAQGTPLLPINFTSGDDDSRGGDSNGDGVSSGTLGSYGSAVRVASSSSVTVTVAYANIAFGGKALDINCGYDTSNAISIVDSTIQAQAAFDSCVAGNFSLKRNQLQMNAADTSSAVSLLNSDPSGLVLGGLDENNFSGSGTQNTIDIIAWSTSNTLLASGSTWDISGTSGAQVRSYGLGVAGTVNLGPGAVIKVGAGSSTYGFNLKNGGVINAAGTSADPVIFTSDKDDGVRGDANADGSSIGQYGDYGTAITTDATGTIGLSIAHAEFRYGTEAVNVDCNFQSTAIATLTDSTFRNRLEAHGCLSNKLSMERNQFQVDSSETQPAVTLIDDEPSGIVLSGSNENTFNGSGVSRTIATVTFGPQLNRIDSGNTWTVAGTSNAVIQAYGMRVAGTLELNAGAIVKVPSGDGLTVGSGGVLTVNGTNTDPATITSIKDDSIGGDTNGDGSSSSPAANDYGYAINAGSGSTITANHLTINYSSHALDATGADTTITNSLINDNGMAVNAVNGDLLMTDVAIDGVSGDPAIGLGGNAKLTFRGSFSGLTGKAIRACSWDEADTCRADVAYNDWGSMDGPFDPSNHANDLVCGMVTVAPWDYASSTYNSSLYNVKNCDGSSAPGYDSSASATFFDQRVASKQIDCSGGFHDACVAATTALNCLNAAIGLAASTTPFPLPGSSVGSSAATYAGDTVNAADTYMQGIGERTPTAAATTVLNKIGQVVGIISSLNTAYTSCAP